MHILFLYEAEPQIMRLDQDVSVVLVVYTRWDPSRRMTAEQAAQHEWIKDNTHRTRMSRVHPRRPSILRSSDNGDKTSGDPYMTTSQAPIKGQCCFLRVLYESDPSVRLNSDCLRLQAVFLKISC